MPPSNLSTICWAIIRPSPMPFMFICWLSSTNPKSLKSFPWSSFKIPIPVSVTLICKYLEFYPLLIISTSVLTSPCCVNFKALDCNPRRTCMILCSSQQIFGLWPLTKDSSLRVIPMKLTPKLMPLSTAFCCYMHITFSTVSRMLKVE